MQSGSRNEYDPTGLGQHAPGAKLDAGKNDLGLVLGDFARALEGVGRVGTYGANKYTPSGWTKVSGGIRRYTSALFRHLFASLKGEEVDQESGLDHDAQVAWNALARYELKLREKEQIKKYSVVG